MLCERSRVDKQHQAKAAMVVKDDFGRCIRFKDYVIVSVALYSGTCRLIHIGAEFKFAILCMDTESPGHAEMHHQRFSAVEIGKQVLRTTGETRHLVPREAFDEARRKWYPEVAAPRFYPRDPSMLQNGREPHAHGFDLGEFRHRVGGIGGPVSEGYAELNTSFSDTRYLIPDSRWRPLAIAMCRKARNPRWCAACFRPSHDVTI